MWGGVKRVLQWLLSKLWIIASILLAGGILVPVADHSPIVVRAASYATVAGGLLLAGLIVGVLLLFIVARWSLATLARTIMILIVVGGFYALIPPFLVSLVTSGGSWSVSESDHGGLPDALGAVGFCCQCASFLVLTAIPAALRNWLPWNSASNLARSLVPSWLAAAATILTWLYIVLLHFSGAALAKDPLSLVVVAGLVTAVLLVPLFQFVARSCWEYGFVAVFDPVRWRDAFRDVYDEVQRARNPSILSEADGPESVSGSGAGPEETVLPRSSQYPKKVLGAGCGSCPSRELMRSGERLNRRSADISANAPRSRKQQ
jgi:hypothetical protein